MTGVQPAGVDANVQRLKQFEEKELFSVGYLSLYRVTHSSLELGLNSNVK